MSLLTRNIFIAFCLVAACAVIFLSHEMYRDSNAQTFPKLCKQDGRKALREEGLTINLPKRNKVVLSKLNEKDKLIETATDPLPLSATCQSSVILAIVVASSPNGFKRRNAIRGTWANSNKKNKLSDKMRIVFLIGRSKDKTLNKLIENEMETFGDIVLGSFIEDYRNLTYKTRLGLKWAYFNCQANYILKTDDDVFINTFALIEWLKSQPKMKFYSGWCNFNSPVVRDPNNKWYISYDDYAGETYPAYCLGGGYIMSKDVLERIIKISYGRKLFPMEDLYVGFMVKDLKDVHPKDNQHGFNLIFNGLQGCAYNKLYLAHPVNPDEQLKMLLESVVAQKTCSQN